GKGSTAWVGHFGVMEGTYCDVRLNPSRGCVVAFTSNANTGRGMWRELVDELRRAGLDLPIRDYSKIETLGRPTVPPPGCVGSYLNGDIEWSVAAADTGALSLIDGDVGIELILFEDLSFSVREQPSTRVGRFLRDSITGELERIQIDRYVARRHRPHVRTALEAQISVV
ncbi:MAG: hypothetical protein ACRDTA_21005, partial [Pseudonocardiaceae bacterium]